MIREMKKKKQPFEWNIHLCCNGIICEDCGRTENGYIEKTCNAHTHGMEKFGHQDFQVVLRMPDKDISYVLNTFGLRVQNGERFKAGDLVEGIFLDCSVRLDEFEETGRKVLRIMIPDRSNVFPDDEKCMQDYRLQMLPTETLHKMRGELS